MTIVDSTFDTNSAEEYAGGIYALVGPSLLLPHSPGGLFLATERLSGTRGLLFYKE